MSDKPLVSYIMGVYNTKKLDDLKRSVDNMLGQTYPNIEVVICDDCSTNGAYEFLVENYGNDNRVKLLRNEENQSLGVTLNRCLEAASGKYIARQDDDDYSAIDRIEKQVDFLESNLEYSLVSAGLAKFDEEGIWSDIIPKPYPEKTDFAKHSQHVHASSLFKKECLTAVGGYRISKETVRAEDYDLFMRIYAMGMKGHNIEEILYYYNTPRNNSKRGKYRYRWYEAIVRFKGFRAMKLPLKYYLYVLRPLIAGLLSENLKNKIKGIKKTKRDFQ